MHMVITNAGVGDPYEHRHAVHVHGQHELELGDEQRRTRSSMLTQPRTPTASYKIPKIIYSDAFASEMVAYADLILPDTTYLERWDCISMLDRPIGEGRRARRRHPPAGGEPDRDVRPFQDVLLDLGVAARSFRAFDPHRRHPRYPGGYADYIVNHERAPGIGPLAGFRGSKNGGNFRG